MLTAFIGKRQLVVSCSLGARGFFPSKTNFSLRKPATVRTVFIGADLPRAPFLRRSSKTLDGEHRWNRAVFKGAG